MHWDGVEGGLFFVGFVYEIYVVICTIRFG